MDPIAPDDTDPGMLEAVQTGVEEADAKDDAQKAEEDAVKKLWEEYDNARQFDTDHRKKIAVDRRYASGTANANFAVSANLIAAFIDILVSFLYARNPDVSVKKSPRVDNRGTSDEDAFAKTMELVIRSLWRAPLTRLKEHARASVRSTLSTGIGWLKVVMVSGGVNVPQMRQQLGDIRDNIAALDALRKEMSDPLYAGEMTPETMNEKYLKIQEQEQALTQRIEVAIRTSLAVDFVSAEDVQVSTDVADVADYLNAGWMANRVYRPTKMLCELFPRLTKDDIQTAACYYQKKPTFDQKPLSQQTQLMGFDDGMDGNAADRFTSSGKTYGSQPQGDENSIPFACIVELWNKETNHIHTMVEGVKRWAKDPYQPDYPTTRFFPYFGLAFNRVDGERYPQSLTERLRKLQDEYSSVRSSLRVTRQRARPGTLFNKTGLGVEGARAIEKSTEQEFVGIEPTSPETPLKDLFAEKPVTVGDIRLYDTTPVLQDMERLSGVQEALQAAVTVEKTATEAQIQESGFASRTNADRDNLEMMLTDLAQYTGEAALSAIGLKEATRIAGAKAFWPHGMAVDDLLTMVEITIEAGSSGKPKAQADQAAWGTVMPLIKETMIQVQQAQMTQNLPLATALEELLRETMVRMGDETDISRFIPKVPTLPAPAGAPGAPAGAAPGGPPGAEGSPAPGAPSPEAGIGDIVAPPAPAG